MKRGLPIALFIALSWVSAFGQGDIRAVVKAVEGRYAVHHHGVPGLWIAKPFMIGSGASGLKMAVFDGFCRTDVTGTEFEAAVQQALGSQWSPFVSVVSNHERTIIYTRPSGSKLIMLVATFEHDGLTLMQMRVGGKAMRDWLDEPVQTASDRRRRTSGEAGKNGAAPAAMVSER